MKTKTINSTKQIAFIVHPDKKTELIEWSYFNKDILQKHEIIATGDTAKMLEGTLNKPVTRYLNGPYEGNQELCNMISDGKIDAVILFRGADETPLQRNGIRSIIHTALEADIIIANNKTTADFIITSPLMVNKNAVKTACIGIDDNTGNSTRQLKKNNAA
ncbi:MAG TPA: methylglyoxal synthase [Chitinophagaceae bacterium]|nr:methylglyoxal synthase [Chitinophagaceae bacterium]